ncbi:hypothetical protein TI05_13600 [Achromatium sp. WMS3]|nr:hypothetical protein TI05_13600 [Achromatium sp. WMS3]
MREASIYSLGQIGPAAIATIPELLKAMADPEPKIRRATIETLGVLRMDTQTQLEDAEIKALLQTITDINATVRLAAANVLGNLCSIDYSIGAKVISGLLQILASDTNKETKETVLKAISHMGSNGTPALYTLLKMLKDNNAQIREATVWAIGKIGATTATAILELVAILTDSNACIRQTAAWALSQIDSPDIVLAVPALIHTCSDALADVRNAAIKTLGNIGSKADLAIPALKIALADADTNVRHSAEKALEQIDPTWVMCNYAKDNRTYLATKPIYTLDSTLNSNYRIMATELKEVNGGYYEY